MGPIRLLREEERQVETLLGHSKGCLSMAFALQAVAAEPTRRHFERARDIAVITTGAVVAFPEGLNRLQQYLGALDWFGGMNSRPRLEYSIPLHMDLARVLADAST